MRAFLGACMFVITVVLTWLLMGVVLHAQNYGPPFPQGSFYQNGVIISNTAYGLVGCPAGEYIKGDGTGCGIPSISDFCTGTGINQVCTFPGTVNANVFNSSYSNVTNSGVFTNTQMNEYFTSSINNINFKTEFQTQQGNTNYATESGAFGVSVPNTSTVFQTNALSGYINSGGSSTNSVAVSGYARATANVAHLWGSNFLFSDGSFSSITGTAGEFDCNVGTITTTGACIQINGGFTGTLSSFPGIQIAPPLSGGKWSAGIAIGNGATQTGFDIGAQGTVASSFGQTINFHAISSGSSDMLTYMQQQTDGSFLINPNFGGSPSYVTSNGGFKATNFESSSANPASTGQLRLASSDAVAFRNNANTGDIFIGKNASDNITLPSLIIGGGSTITSVVKGSGTVTFTSITAPACQEQSLTITGASGGDACFASPAGDIGSSFINAGCRISTTNTAQIKVCATVTGTPASTTWTGWAIH